jgi:hypothetical protein
MAFTGNFACDSFKTGLLDGIFNFDSGSTQVYKIALYTNAATLNQDTLAYTTSGETTGNGYVAGGKQLTVGVYPTNSNDVSFFSFNDISWTGSSFTARGALIYKFDGATNPAVCVLDFGSDKTTTNGTFTVQFPSATSTSAVIRIS